MKASQNCINLISKFENCKLTAYQDSAGYWTIGFGHKAGVKRGMKITQEQALTYLRNDIVIVENAINKKGYSLNQNQFDSLVSFFYNLGTTAITKYDFNSILKTNPRSSLIPTKMKQFVYAGGVKLNGLITRRQEETRLYTA